MSDRHCCNVIPVAHVKYKNGYYIDLIQSDNY